MDGFTIVKEKPNMISKTTFLFGYLILYFSGPHKLNNFPLRRIAQAFVIATKTKIDVSGVKIPDHINDDYFRRKPKRGSSKKGGDIFTSGKEEYKVCFSSIYPHLLFIFISHF